MPIPGPPEPYTCADRPLWALLCNLLLMVGVAAWVGLVYLAYYALSWILG